MLPIDPPPPPPVDAPPIQVVSPYVNAERLYNKLSAISTKDPTQIVSQRISITALGGANYGIETLVAWLAKRISLLLALATATDDVIIAQAAQLKASADPDDKTCAGLFSSVAPVLVPPDPIIITPGVGDVGIGA